MGLEGGFSDWWRRPTLCSKGSEFFGDDENSFSNFRFLPQILVGAILPPVSKRAPEQKSPPKRRLRARCCGHSCHEFISLLICCAMCPRWAQPILLDSASSSCCCTFSSNFCVAMAEQLCSNPWRNIFVEGQIWDYP